MTSNPRWREIREGLLDGQAPHDRPDLMARIFRLKLTALLSDVHKRGIFGKTVAGTYVVEYQKRGLPHAHILIILEPTFRPFGPADIDSMISAELPNQHTHPLLWESVTSCMMHGPCGILNPRSPCMINGHCKFRYPRTYQEETSCAEDGYPTYRRRNDSTIFERNGFSFDNRWVVPHNPYLTGKYDCHINVEIASSISAVKYLFKYVYKGSDRSSFVLHTADQEINEIQHYLDGRYISPVEACYRLFGYDLTEHFPSVVRLVVHAENEQVIQFNADLDPTTFLARTKRSQLEAFFDFCRENPAEVDGLLYPDAPSRLTWLKKEGAWKTRGRNAVRAVGRIRWVPPVQENVSDSGDYIGDKLTNTLFTLQVYHIRRLLYVIKAPTSFEALRTVHGAVCGTAKEACLALGLLENDDLCDQCLIEAATFQTGYAVRSLFMTLVVYAQSSDPRALLNRHRDILSDGCRHRLIREFGIESPTAGDIWDLALADLASLAERHGRTMDELNLPAPTRIFGVPGEAAVLTDELSYDRRQLNEDFDRAISLGNAGQQFAITAVTNAVDRHTGQHFFLDGPGGTGKTFVERACLAYVRSHGAIALAVASSGVAALLLPNGRTAHSRFKIPIDITPDSICNISAQSARAELFRRTELVVWDEAVMQHQDCIMAVDRMLRDVRRRDILFGGVVMLFAGESSGLKCRRPSTDQQSGDMRQCLPIVKKASRSEIVAATISRAPFWSSIETLRLHENMRLTDAAGQNGAAFAAWLLSIGQGDNVGPDGKVDLPLDICLPTTSDRDDLIHQIYPGIQDLNPEDHTMCMTYFEHIAILAPHNLSVDDINNRLLLRMPGEAQEFRSADAAILQDETPALLPDEYVNTLQPDSFPPHLLTLKVGIPVILLRNLSPSEGLCNGTRLLITRLGARVICCKILTAGTWRTDQRSEVFIPRIKLTSNPSADLPFTLRRSQFPIRLAFGMSINKAQGQSLQRVGLDLTKPVFSHGQLYVGLSRSTRSDSVVTLLPEDSTNRAINIIYREVFDETMQPF